MAVVVDVCWAVAAVVLARTVVSVCLLVVIACVRVCAAWNVNSHARDVWLIAENHYVLGLGCAVEEWEGATVAVGADLYSCEPRGAVSPAVATAIAQVERVGAEGN